MSTVGFSVKMRASLAGRHISGAERIVPAESAAKTVAALAVRALSHPAGAPDFVSIKLEEAREPLELESLPVTTCAVGSVEEGWRKAKEVLGGFDRIDDIVGLFPQASGMRGAMLVDADTLERLEPDHVRGVRATYMDSADGACAAFSAKDHYSEAVVLATKVQSAPGIVGEICVSDDPGYTTGYVATREAGYVRITKLKETGDPRGGRIFLYRGRREDVPRTVEYLEKRCVTVKGIPPRGAFSPAKGAALAGELEKLKEDGLFRVAVKRAPGTIDFSSNDYLGLARNEEVEKAAAAAAMEYGAGSGASRLVTGTLEVHERFERHIAAFKGYDAAISYPAGYMANLAVVTALSGKGSVVVSDALNHASIIDGARLSGAEVAVYGHLDMAGLENILSRTGGFKRRVVVTDGVFSMDGDMVDLEKFTALCARYDAFSVVDEAHALGTVGETGRGLCEVYAGVKPDVTVGTMSKALGSQGGYACAGRDVVGFLRQKSRQFMFSTAAAPACVAAADAALSILERDPSLAERLRENVRFALSTLGAAGIACRTSSAIIPVAIGDEKAAVEVSRRLEERGIIAKAIRYPTVARGKAIIRIAMSAARSKEEIVRLAEALAEAMRPAAR